MRLDYTLVVPSSIQFHPPVFNAPVTRPGLSAASSQALSSLAANPKGNDKFNYRQLCKSIADNIYFFFYSFFNLTLVYPPINYNVTKKQLQSVYFGLGDQKWRECIDGCHHDKGKFVYDLALHGGTKEPKFIESMESAFNFVKGYLNQKVDAIWYLRLHKHTCAHFDGNPDIYLMGQEKVGVFRDFDDNIGATFSNGVYRMTKEALQEFCALDLELQKEFGDSYGLGYFEDKGQGALYLHYKQMTRAQVTEIFNHFLSDFYKEVEQASTPPQKIQAIAKLHQRLEWLHPVRDGTSRTSIAFMNKNLVDYGFHPAILEYPHVSSSYGLAQWTNYLIDGLQKWQHAKTQVV